MSGVKVQMVRFRENVKIPGQGEKTGLSNLRVMGGNEAPVDHEMNLDEGSGWLTIKHLGDQGAFPTVRVPAGNIAYVEEQATRGGSQTQHDAYKPRHHGQSYDPTAPHDPSAPLDRTVPLDPKSGQPLYKDASKDPNAPFDRTQPEGAVHDPLDPADPNKPYDASKPYDPNAPGNKNKPHDASGKNTSKTKDDTSGSDPLQHETKDPNKPDEKSARAAASDPHGFKGSSAEVGDKMNKKGGDQGGLAPDDHKNKSAWMGGGKSGTESKTWTDKDK